MTDDIEHEEHYSRWTDNPFRRHNLTPEQLAWVETRSVAIRIFHDTGDTRLAEDIGLFPKQPRRMYSYSGHQFHVIRKGDDAAYVGLWCPTHIHQVYIIGITEDGQSLLVGRPEGNQPKYEVSSFQEAVEYGAQLLLQDCPLEKQMDDFFSDDDEWIRLD